MSTIITGGHFGCTMHTYGGGRETFRIYEYKNLVTGERAYLWVNKANKVRYQGNRSISEWHGNFSDDDDDFGMFHPPILYLEMS